MKTLSQYGRTGLGALVLLTAGLPARGESFAVNTPKTADRIDFKVDLQPADPFSDANKVGRRAISAAARWCVWSFRGRRERGSTPIR